MKVVIKALASLAVVGTIMIGVLLNYNKQTAAVWVTFATIVALALGLCLYWQKSIWDDRKTQQQTTISQSQPATSQEPKLEFPTFSEETPAVNFSLGERGISVGYSRQALIEAPKEPFSFSGFSPVRLYLEDDNLYADVTIYGGSGLPPIQIKHNKLINKPTGWDFNSNKKALEIVNDKSVPIYQFYYKASSHIVVNGVFPFPGGLILANESGAILNPSLPTQFRLNPIFKYPAWKYPGEYSQN